MSSTYVTTASGGQAYTTNTMLDGAGSPQAADNFLLDGGAASVQVFYDQYPTSTLPGSNRMFTSYTPRVFMSKGFTRKFKS
jgi:hypothetical protein